MNTEEVAAFIALDLSPPEAMPEMAVKMIMDGMLSPALADLASRTTRDDPSDLRDLMRQVVKELDLDLPNTQTAAEIAKRYYARMVVEGAISPEAGAFHIIHDLYVGKNLCRETDEYVGEAFGIHQLVGPYYDLECADSVARLDIKREIKAACMSIVQQGR